EAVAFGGTERASRAASEKDALLQQLAAALGLGGRDRQISSSISERARINVTRTIRAAIEKIGASSPEIGRHLRATIRTGLFCCYDPAPGAPGPWLVG